MTGSIKYCNGNFSDDTLVFNGTQLSVKDNDNQSSVVCKRAEEITLHTEKCEQKDGTWYCSGAGLTGKTITYGTISNGELKSGDAFDCDVNGDGTYDSKKERFYYVSDYYNTSTKEFESDTAVLIYYNNVSNGKPSNSTKYAYDLSRKNYNGPVTAIEQLPSIEEWKNVSLKNSVRTITNEKGTNTTYITTLPSDFSYKGKAARLLTIEEVRKSAGNNKIPTYQVSELNNFNYLFENTKYSNAGNSAQSWWLENPMFNTSDYAFYVSGLNRYVHTNTVSDAAGVRPAIEVPKSNIEY